MKRGPLPRLTESGSGLDRPRLGETRARGIRGRICYAGPAHSLGREGMRTVYPNDEVPHVWAHGIDRTIKGRGSIFAERDTIYSYGHHFPMARRVVLKSGGVVFLVNPRSYSITTSKHQSWVHRAIHGNGRSLHLPPGERQALWDALVSRDSGPVVDYYRRELSEGAKAAVQPRIRATTRAERLARLGRLVEEWREVHGLFGLRCSVTKVQAPTDLEAVKARVASEAASVARAQAREAKERERQTQARHDKALAKVPAWRNGADAQWGELHGLRYPVLRVSPSDPETLESSMGARVPMDHARKVWGILPRLRERLGTDPGAELGSYRGITATADALIVGCHRIPWHEVEEFARHVGWKPAAAAVA